jgi:hypothetical protein|tara:strand:- start:857 stop:1294 length:438 start_codon:yes stop_codon:yes gene_type:complete
MSEYCVLEEFPHIHTNRELELMLCGKKPLAWFSDAIASLPDEEIIPENSYSEYVEEGIFIKAELHLQSKFKARDGSFPIIKHVFFAGKDEVWRIEAFKLLQIEFNRTGLWNELLERMEGTLLGYTDHENDLWCCYKYGDSGDAEI